MFIVSTFRMSHAEGVKLAETVAGFYLEYSIKSL